MKHPWIAASCATALGVSLALTALSAPNNIAAPAENNAGSHGASGQPATKSGSPAEKAAPAAAPMTPDELADQEAMGAIYESQSAGISFRPPAGCKLVETISSKWLAEWTDSQRGWTLELGRMVLDPPAPLVHTKNNFGKDVDGILERTVRNLQFKLPGSKVLRQDLTNTRDGGVADPRHPGRLAPNVGLIAIRYTIGGKRKLSQQAIIQANENLYYLLTLTTPGSNALDLAANDPVERVPADVFEKMLDTVRLLDRSAIKKDQDDRLFRTRSFLVNLTPSRLHAALINEQWIRIIKNGKDVGYSYITEEQAAGIPRRLTTAEMQEDPTQRKEVQEKLKGQGDGILIGVRARMMTQGLRSDHSKGPIQMDSASWFFVTSDKKHEEFSRIVVTDDHKRPVKGHVEEVGLSERHLRRVYRKPPPDPKGGVIQPDQPPIPVLTDDYELHVDQTSSLGAADPLMRKPPPWYVSQAVSHLLPRLMPLNRPRGYLFATYVSDAREVMMRYIDVLPEQQVTFNGQSVRAVPIQDRLGLEGSITTHYMSPEGIYLGSENKDQKLVMLPTNARTLQRIWANANLTRPGATERRNPIATPSERPAAIGGAPPIEEPVLPGAQ